VSGRTDSSNAMWGGRFAEGPASVMREINASIGFDKRLAPQDIRGSKAHAQMLADAGFTHVEVQRVPDDILNVYYIASRE